MLDVERKMRKSKTPRARKVVGDMDVNIRLTADAMIKAGIINIYRCSFLYRRYYHKMLGVMASHLAQEIDQGQVNGCPSHSVYIICPSKIDKKR
jgi:hypothetical protein